jgi:hypothetical protein
MYEYEPGRVFKFFKDTQDIRSEMACFAWLRGNYFGKIFFSEVAETYFTIFFLHGTLFRKPIS